MLSDAKGCASYSRNTATCVTRLRGGDCILQNETEAFVTRDRRMMALVRHCHDTSHELDPGRRFSRSQRDSGLSDCILQNEI